MPNAHLLSVSLGLSSAAAWGAGDFLGGLLTRRAHVLPVLFLAQFAGAVALLCTGVFIGEPLPGSTGFILGAAAGLCGAVGLGAFSQGLAVDRMGVVSPLTAVISAAIPIVVGLFLEGAPAGSTLAGFVLAGVAVWVLTASGSARADRSELFYSIISGTGFALFLIIIDRAGESGIFWPLIAARCTAMTLVGLLLLHKRLSPFPTGPGTIPLALLCGLFDAAGNGLYAAAASLGRMDVAVVTAGLYPAGTVLMAAIILKETLNKRQYVGVGVALAALVLIAL